MPAPAGWGGLGEGTLPRCPETPAASVQGSRGGWRRSAAGGDEASPSPGVPPPLVAEDTMLVAPLGRGRVPQRDTGRSLPAPPSSSPAPRAAASLPVLEMLLHHSATCPWPCPPQKTDLLEGPWGQPQLGHGARVLGATGCLSPSLWLEALGEVVPMAPRPPWLRRSTGHILVPVTAGGGDGARPDAVSVLPAQPRCHEQDPGGCPRCPGCPFVGPRAHLLLSRPAARAMPAAKRCHFLPLGFCRGGGDRGLLLNRVCIFGAF